MKRHDVVPGLTTLLLAITIASAAAGHASPAAGPATIPAPGARASGERAPSSPPDSSRALRLAPVGMDPIVLRLRRAAAEQRLGNDRGVVEWLEPLDFSAPTFPEADRAAFLLAQAYRRLGSTRAFVEVARAVSGWERRSLYVEHLARELATIEADGARLGAGSDSSARAAARVAPPRSALALALETERLEAAGRDDEAALVSLSTADTTTLLGRDLAGAARVRLATRRLARGEDATALLEAVPAGCRHAPLARHMLGLALLERGNVERGAQVLKALLDSDTTYAGRREARLTLAALALEAGRWDEAEQAYQATDVDAARQRDALLRLRATGAFDTLWAAWRASGAGLDAVTLDPRPTLAASRRLAIASADLGAPPPPDRPIELAPRRAATAPAPPPLPEEWHAVNASQRESDQARERAERAGIAVEREQARLGAVRRYLSDGRVQVWRATVALEAHARQLDSLATRLDALDHRVRTVRDETRDHLLRRARAILERCARHTLWIAAMDRLHLQGPHRERSWRVPPGVPEPEAVLAAERAVTDSVRALVERLEAEWPDLIARSYTSAWRPRLIDRTSLQAAEAGRLLASLDALDGSIARHILSLAGRDSLRRLVAQAARLDSAALAREAAHRELETRIARSAIDRALLTVGAEREAVDYGLAATAYALSVRLDAAGAAAGATESRAVVVGAGAGRDSARSAAEDDGLDDPRATAWRQRAIPRMRAFLAAHPRSEARADVRFRLADLLLVDERQKFRDGMARFVRDQEQGGAGRVPLPVLDSEPALALYRAILAEDRSFAHRDAVLFDAGTLLADQGDPGCDALFQRLVAEHADSRYVPEAYLRMGDLRFDDRRFGECVPLYERAAAGGDPTLRAIALYKLGWAHFNAERFDDAADAFRSVLDVYDSTRVGLVQVDLDTEAESYLVHTLARAGGAEAFARHFAGAGARRYERRVLRSLGHHFRRYSLFAEAAATERLALERDALEPDALAAADRLIETYRRWDRADETRAARLECAPRFAPGSPWARAQTSDSLRATGAEFARSAWTAAALEHHRRARERGARDDWREALRLYDLLLATFPGEDARPIALNAGEASAKLGDHPRALRHYADAASTGADSVAAQALWQRVAVADAWYETTRPAPAAAPRAAAGATGAGRGRGAATTRRREPAAERGAGRDSLARVVLANADELLRRFPDHPRGADLRWRQGQLALAHGWEDRAAEDLGRLAASHPGDPRAAAAAGLQADALFRSHRYEEAGAAYERTAAVARAAGNDSLERRATRAVPVCAYRRAEAAVAADSTDHTRHAALFEAVAARFPSYEHAARCQYRAGLAHLAARDRPAAVRALWVVVRRFATSEFVKDAYLQIARAEESQGDRRRAAEAYAEFAGRFPDDENAGAAWLRAADHAEAAGLAASADSLRLTYVRRRPADVETAMQVFESLARRELATVGSERPISSLLPPAPKRAAAGRKSARSPSPAAASATPAAPASYLAEYLERAARHPDLASKSLVAQVRFLEGEEAREPYLAVRLTQPLEKSIATKQRLLDPMIARYRRSVDQGVAEWAHASTYRIGEALVAFGDALERSERPADLTGEDLAAYDEVIVQQSQAFYDRGEAVWTDLVKPQQPPAPDDARDRWIVLAQQSLWKRLGARFAYLPEPEFPRVEAREPERPKVEKAPRPGSAGKARGGERSKETPR